MSDETQAPDADGVDWNNAKIIGSLDGKLEVPEPAPEISGDAMLNIIVGLAEKGLGQGITLYTHGLVLTGITASRKKYFEGSLEFANAGNSPMSYLFEEVIKTLNQEEEKDGPSPDYRYIHLRDAQVITPGQGGMPAEGILMRISRADVIGWSMGQLKAANK